MTEQIRIVIADDQQLIRASFRVLVESQPGLVVVGEAGNGQDAVAVAAAERPDVVLMDIRMPVLDGIEATRHIVGDRRTDARVLILTTYDLDEYVYAALRAGASGFLLKDAPPADLLAAIRIVAGGEALLAPSITQRLIAEFVARPEPKPAASAAALAAISEREREVLLLVARGRSNAQIAEALHISLATAKTYISRLLTKLDARDRVHLVILAYESRLVEPG